PLPDPGGARRREPDDAREGDRRDGGGSAAARNRRDRRGAPPRHARPPRGADRAPGRIPRSGLAKHYPLLTGVFTRQSRAGSRTHRSPTTRTTPSGCWAIGARSDDDPATDRSAIVPWRRKTILLRPWFSKVPDRHPRPVTGASPPFRFVRLP